MDFDFFLIFVKLINCKFKFILSIYININTHLFYISNIEIAKTLFIKYFNQVIVITDNDDAGDRMYDKIVEGLGGRVSRIKLDSQYKDIGDMSDDDIKNLKYSFDKDILQMIGY